MVGEVRRSEERLRRLAVSCRSLANQFVIHFVESVTVRQAHTFKEMVDNWLQTSERALVSGQWPRAVMNVPSSHETRERAGGRAYGVSGGPHPSPGFSFGGGLGWLS